MLNLPVIVGFGGVNAAGRASFHHGHNRMVFDALSQDKQRQTLQSLSALMGVEASDKQFILANSLIRKISDSHFDTTSIPWNRKIIAKAGEDQPIIFEAKAKSLPEVLPHNWTVQDLGAGQVRITATGDSDFMIPAMRQATVTSAGMLPEGFKPGAGYQSRNHPRGIEMTVYGASDALNSMGIDWDLVRSKVSPDYISVYAGSSMSQLDNNGYGGMMKSRLTGKKVTSKHCPFGFAEMPADFINAYLLGSVGTTGTAMGACASFLYNLRMAVADIQSGKARVAIVGNAESPILPEIMEGYSAMGALVTDAELRELDGSDVANNRRACRPFSTNKGFTIAESAQFIVLFDDALAMEMGATIHGAVGEVFVNADGYKKSISAPGVGNYVTVAKAMAAARSIIGEKAFRERAFFQAHGTSTPQNRVTESHIINEAAKHFGMDNFLVGAVKSYLGHSIGCAGGDQIAASLGIFNSGLFPGITTIDHIADDVHHSHLHIPMQHVEVGQQGLDVGIINAKGFGGNNATATLLAPHIAEQLIATKYGASEISAYKAANEAVRESAATYDEKALSGDPQTIYRFDYGVCDENSVHFSDGKLAIDGFESDIDLTIKSAYAGLLG
ncbi:MAG: beta-ketoacyl synthase [Pseudomonadales bacterium]|nr:beta-ketoacyl synthase [Pseudomonadales bacterium]